MTIANHLGPASGRNIPGICALSVPLQQLRLWMAGRLRRLAGWWAVQHERKVYSQMLEADEHMLVDIGVTRHDLHLLVQDPRRSVPSRRGAFTPQMPTA